MIVAVGIFMSPSIKENIGGKKGKSKMKRIIFLLTVMVFVCPSFADFISSKTSKIFHTRECRYAANLNEDNAIIYETYQDAIDAELRACLVCDPQPDPEKTLTTQGQLLYPQKKHL